MEKDKLRVIFSRNKDRKTATMFISNFLIDEDIPYLPHKATDHRGAALYFYAQENSLDWRDFELDEFTEKPEEVERGFFHLSHPELINEAIEESNEQRRLQRRKMEKAKPWQGWD